MLLASQLSPLLTGSKERVGFILANGELVEVENVCSEPEQGFEVSGADLVKYEHDAIATWHTHPGKDSNLSVNDYRGFKNWPKLTHYIVGIDGVSGYAIDNGALIKVSVDGA